MQVLLAVPSSISCDTPIASCLGYLEGRTSNLPLQETKFEDKGKRREILDWERRQYH